MFVIIVIVIIVIVIVIIITPFVDHEVIISPYERYD